MRRNSALTDMARLALDIFVLLVETHYRELELARWADDGGRAP